MNLGLMDIYKHAGGDCSNGGISSRHDSVMQVDDFDINAADNAVVIVEDMCMGSDRIRALPANKGGRWAMFGGCFVYTSNGCTPHSGVCIPLHDRFEDNDEKGVV